MRRRKHLLLRRCQSNRRTLAGEPARQFGLTRYQSRPGKRGLKYFLGVSPSRAVAQPAIRLLQRQPGPAIHRRLLKRRFLQLLVRSVPRPNFPYYLNLRVTKISYLLALKLAGVRRSSLKIVFFDLREKRFVTDS